MTHARTPTPPQVGLCDPFPGGAVGRGRLRARRRVGEAVWGRRSRFACWHVLRR